jgi:hypothetical protein
MRAYQNLNITGSINLSGSFNAGNLNATASYALTAITSSYPVAILGSTLYTPILPTSNFNTTSSVFLGRGAGNNATNANSSNFIGNGAGESAASASNSNFLGRFAGANATNANNSNFLGFFTGTGAISASYSNFLGENAGNGATNASGSNFLGQNAGRNAANASYSTLIGFNVGTPAATVGIGSNNIIIGTGITLGDNRRDSINLGGLIFGTGSYSDIFNTAFAGSANGRIGINQPFPTFSLDVSGSGRYTNGLSVTGSLNVSGSIVGSLQGTASFTTTASYALTAVSSSYPIAVSGSTIYSPIDPISNFSTSNGVFLGRLAGSGSAQANFSIFIGQGAGQNASSASYSNFIGAAAGGSATAAIYSNFIGGGAGFGATNAANSNFIGQSAGSNAISANNSNFIGTFAGLDSISASYSNFLGVAAGQNAPQAFFSNFLGGNTGLAAISASNSNFLGQNAGFSASLANNSNFIGQNAGRNAASASNSNFLGQGAGLNATNANSSNFLGLGAGSGSTSAYYSNFLGFNAGISASNAYISNFLGGQAGEGATNANNSNFLGLGTGQFATNAANSNFLGQFAGASATDADHSNFIGRTAGQNAASASYSTLIGYQVGRVVTGPGISSNNIIIGTNITLPNNTSNGINIGGLLFGSGSYFNTVNNAPFAGPADGRIGINQPFPTFSLDVSGSGRYTNGLSVTGSFGVLTTGSVVEFQVTNTGVVIGNVIGDIHRITGSVNISGSLLINGAAPGAGGGASVTISGSAPSGSNPSGSLWWNDNDGNLYIQVTSPSGSTYVPATNTVAGGNYGATFRNNYAGSTWTVQHNLGTTTPIVTIYSGSQVMIPATITSTDVNTTIVTFASAVSGSAVLSTGVGGPTSSSFALSAVSAQTASFATTASFAQTASFVNSLSQSVLISGTLDVLNNEFQVTSTGIRTGNALTDTHQVTGSLRVTGSITGSLFGTASVLPTPATSIQAVNTTTQTFANLQSTTITGWTNQIAINAGEWNASTGVFTSAGPGTYMVACSLQLASHTYGGANSEVSFFTTISGGIGGGVTRFFNQVASFSGLTPTLQFTCLVRFTAAGQTMRLQIYNATGASMSNFTDNNGTAITIQEVSSTISL